MNINSSFHKSPGNCGALIIVQILDGTSSHSVCLNILVKAKPCIAVFLIIIFHLMSYWCSILLSLGKRFGIITVNADRVKTLKVIFCLFLFSFKLIQSFFIHLFFVVSDKRICKLLCVNGVYSDSAFLPLLMTQNALQPQSHSPKNIHSHTDCYLRLAPKYNHQEVFGVQGFSQRYFDKQVGKRGT